MPHLTAGILCIDKADAGRMCYTYLKINGIYFAPVCVLLGFLMSKLSIMIKD